MRAVNRLTALLDKAPLSVAVKRQTHDAFHGSETTDDLEPLLRQLPLPQLVRRQLWDLKAEEERGNMLPRESRFGRDGQALPEKKAEPSDTTSAVAKFMDDHYHHFNAGTLNDAAKAYKKLIDGGGQMFLAMAGAASTAEFGRILAPMIREGKISAMSVTGANLEEDLFLLVGKHEYKELPHYHEHTPEQDQQLGEDGHPRVTDVSIPEDAAMIPVQEAVMREWDKVHTDADRQFPHEYLYDVIRSRALANDYQGREEDSWLCAAADTDLPIFVYGWEDSTLGNVFAAACLEGEYAPWIVRTGIEYMMDLAAWYEEASAGADIGFCQLGGGIAGDGPICVVPMLLEDLKRKDTKKWKLFIQMTDADESMGGYSGALPTEKNSWLKIDPDTPTFNIKGDFTISFPLLAAVVMGW